MNFSNSASVTVSVIGEKGPNSSSSSELKPLVSSFHSAIRLFQNSFSRNSGVKSCPSELVKPLKNDVTPI